MSPAPAFRIGTVLVDPPVLLAPMEDVTSLPFRRIVKRIAGPGLMFTEFVSAMAVRHNPKSAMRKMLVADDERPLGVQIFGADPDVLAETARIAESMGADLVDVNMGCWVPKVCRTGAGAALLKDPDTAERIVVAVARAVSIPVTVKVRAGWDYSLFAAPELAVRFQDAGAKMVTLHARFAKQGFEGEANWDLIRELRSRLSIPLTGNGDVKTPEDAVRMFESTGCDGVMVGRAAISDPWALARIVAGATGKPIPAEPTLGERVAVALEHLQGAVEYVGDEPRGVRSLRGQLPMYIKGAPGAAQTRSKLSLADSISQVEDILSELLHKADPKCPASATEVP